MPRPNPISFFKQSLKSDSYYADEVINIYLLRPLAAVIVWLLYPTRVTPNQVTVIAVAFGLAAALFYLSGTPGEVAVAGLLVTAKDVFDDADGQLARLRAETPSRRTNSLTDGHSGVQARAKEMYSRRGRFLDSIGDFAVDLAVFSAITYAVWQTHPGLITLVLGFLALLGITLRVSYHVFYQVSFLHLKDRYTLNRIVEDITDEDRRGDRVAFRLQQIFLFIYGWQDRLMYRLDKWCRREVLSDNFLSGWYSNRFALRLSGLLGFGTEFALLTLCSLFNELYLYLLLNVFLMNGIWLVGILYRRVILAGRVNQ
jgi:phosphatidylglycerophosphate synthase